jgi:hypothetical protein
MAEKPQSKMLKLTGLWRNTSQNGNEYFSGTLGVSKILIFPNQYRKGDSSPTHWLYLAQREDDRQSADTTGDDTVYEFDNESPF